MNTYAPLGNCILMYLHCPTGISSVCVYMYNTHLAFYVFNIQNIKYCTQVSADVPCSEVPLKHKYVEGTFWHVKIALNLA